MKTDFGKQLPILLEYMLCMLRPLYLSYLRLYLEFYCSHEVVINVVEEPSFEIQRIITRKYEPITRTRIKPRLTQQETLAKGRFLYFLCNFPDFLHYCFLY